LSEGLIVQIYNRTGGVPLLVEEFSRLACESAVLEPRMAAGVSSAAEPAQELPATLQELVLAKLDRISDSREVAQLAATLGREFAYDLLAAVVAVDEVTPGQSCPSWSPPESCMRQEGRPNAFTSSSMS
jgi:predicted ATPase